MVYFLIKTVKDAVNDIFGEVNHQLTVRPYKGDYESALREITSGKYFWTGGVVEFQQGFYSSDEKIESEQEFLVRCAVNGHYPDFEIDTAVDKDGNSATVCIKDIHTGKKLYRNGKKDNE